MAEPTYAQRLAQELIDQGRIMEAGWQSLKVLSISPQAPAVQIQEMRNVFYAGASWLLDQMLKMLEPGEDPSEADERRMKQLQQELDSYWKNYFAENGLELPRRRR